MTKRHMTELEQMTMLNATLESALDHQAKHIRYLKRNLIRALVYVALCLTVLAGVILWFMAPHLLVPATQLIATLLHSTIIHWTLLSIGLIIILGVWAWVIWIEINHDGVN